MSLGPLIGCPECGSANVTYEDWHNGFWCGACGNEWPCGCKIKRTAHMFGIEVPLSTFALNRGLVDHEILYCPLHESGPELLRQVKAAQGGNR